jgi:hypothetical protein
MDAGRADIVPLASRRPSCTAFLPPLASPGFFCCQRRHWYMASPTCRTSLSLHSLSSFPPTPLFFVSLCLSLSRARLSLHSLFALSPCLSIVHPLSSKPLSLSCSLSHRRVHLDRETDSMDSKQATMGIAHAGPAPAAMCELTAVTTDCLVMRNVANVNVANVSCLMCELISLEVLAVTTDSGSLQLGVACSCHMSDEELEVAKCC